MLGDKSIFVPRKNYWGMCSPIIGTIVSSGRRGLLNSMEVVHMSNSGVLDQKIVLPGGLRKLSLFDDQGVNGGPRIENNNAAC
jgi:hypothetical protein